MAVGAGLGVGVDVDVGTDVEVDSGVMVGSGVTSITTSFIKTSGVGFISSSPPQAMRNITARAVTKRNIFLIRILLILFPKHFPSSRYPYSKNN